MASVRGYEFLLDFGDRQEWSQLAGNGGAIGNSALYVTDVRSVNKIAQKLLRVARNGLERDGFIVLANDARYNEPLKREKAVPVAISDSRAMFGKD